VPDVLPRPAAAVLAFDRMTDPVTDRVTDPAQPPMLGGPTMPTRPAPVRRRAAAFPRALGAAARTAAVVAAAVGAAAGCGEEIPGPSHTIAVRTASRTGAIRVEPAGVDTLEIVFRPEPGQRFATQACGPGACPVAHCCSYEAGDIVTYTSSAGEFVMLVDGDYVRARMVDIPAGFYVPIPVYSQEGSVGTAGDPVVRATVIRRGERIAIGEARASWPLQGNAATNINGVICATGYEAQCANMDPMPVTAGGDAGP
jgi:hypothetical protein